MFKLKDQRYAVDGSALRDERKRLGVKVSVFADACGWSAAYQYKLERGEIETVSESTKCVIECTLRKIACDARGTEADDV